MTPDALIAMLAERDIVLENQPRIFESVIPPDRRRFRSQPGGVPAADVLWTESGSRTLVEIDGEDFAAEIAQHLLSGKSILIDASARLGCLCSGAVVGSSAKQARPKVIALEPPRATIPVVDEQAPIELDLAVPAAPRGPIDVIAASNGSSSLTSAASSTPPRGFEAPSLGHRISPVRGFAPVPDPRQPRVSGPGTPPPSRPVVGTMPVARAPEGKSLPRAYIARRRASPRSTPAVRPATAAPLAMTVPEVLEHDVQSNDDEAETVDVVVESDQHILGLPFQRIPFHYVVLILVAVAVTIVASSAIAVVASRSLSRPPVASPTTTP
jgi:hypothetical protein